MISLKADETMVTAPSSNTTSSLDRTAAVLFVEVDVIVPVHNAAATLRETLQSALHQVWPARRRKAGEEDPNESRPAIAAAPVEVEVVIYVCCYNDASTDASWSILQELQKRHNDAVAAAPKKCQHGANNNNDKNTPPRPATDDSNEAAVDDDDEDFFPLPTHLCLATSPEGRPSRGAGYARNRAVELRPALDTTRTNPSSSSAAGVQQRAQQFLCWLDSDDIMHPRRVYHQVSALLALSSPAERHGTLLGSRFDRIPADATWHYTHWANHHLIPERLALERFREVTLLQPTWMMSRSRFDQLGGYLEAPPPSSLPLASLEDSSSSSSRILEDWIRTQQQQEHQRWRLVHTTGETPITLRWAEDLRLFHEHLRTGDGRLQRCEETLVTYRHRPGQSQSSQTPRSLLLQLRALAWETSVLWRKSDPPQAKNDSLLEQQQQQPHPATRNDQDPNKHIINPPWHRFVIWGAGRDGKDLIQALSPAARRCIYCLVDVDDKKIAHGVYEYRCRRSPPSSERKQTKNEKTIPMRIPIVHFSLLAKDETVRNALYRAWKEEGNGGTENGMSLENGTASSSLAPAYGRIDKTNRAATTATTIAAETTTNASTTIVLNSKSKPPLSSSSSQKRRKTANAVGRKKDPGVAMLDLSLLPTLPVLVCVAMYRTAGALERNVSMIGRTEGQDLWHFS